MEELVKYIVNQLVDDKDNVEISTEEASKETVIKVVVAKNDMGRVIGRNGKIAQSIRAIVKTASVKDNKKYFVKFEEKAE